MNSCGLCLNIDTPVSRISDSDAFKHLQGILINYGFQLGSRSNICFLCKHLLIKYFSFIKRILRAQAVLRDLKNEGSSKITDATLKSLDRSKLNLNLNLSCQNVECFDSNVQVQVKDDGIDDDDTSCQSEEELSLADLQKMKQKSAMFLCQPEPELNLLDLQEIKNEPEIHYELTITKNKNQTGSHTKGNESVKPHWRWKPTPVQLMPSKLRNKTNNKKTWVESDLSENEAKKDKKKNRKRKKREKDDDEFIPVQTESESEESDDSDEIYFDEKGRMKKVPKRIYPMECEECDADIPSASEHYRHYINYHKDKKYPYEQKNVFVCQHCGVTRRTKYHLAKHELFHGQKTASCTECGKKFYSELHLLRHIRRHRKEVKYFCDYCNKGFLYKPDLVLHIRVHTGERPFKCHICGHGFAYKGNIKLHIQLHHQKDPEVIKKMKTKLKNKQVHKKKISKKDNVTKKQDKEMKTKQNKENRNKKQNKGSINKGKRTQKKENGALNGK